MTESHDLADQLPRPIGFVLGGGGSLGAAQVGMLEALAEVPVRADLVAGTSVGALNGAVVASDPVGAAHRLSHIWHDLETDMIMPGGLWARVTTVLRSRTNLYDSPRIGRLVAEEIGEEEIGQLPLPYLAMAVDADTAEPVQLTDGPLLSAMLASSAIPGVFPVVHRGGRDLYDGGLAVNTPVLEALAMGAGSLVVLDCNYPDRQIKRPTTVPEAILYAATIAARQQMERDLPVAAREVPVLVLPGPEYLPGLSPLDFTGSTPLIASAYEAGRHFLSTVKVDGPGLYRC
ncbi:patatin-like phospholipase family protein [Dietzia sp. ANT_WB102]|uniref:patatin-like phospholipase family protein n=1 Tax=Dietzia sp. ANT_WB102 TaxID=2597345 RepID=UPI0011EE890A|nr:patatin-like phospholipase family protein [Dietzia sp. ANT_WB102]KAA0918327.1 patatin-like phospholipase family protein [Dietzia sp. ANT_WB102]